MTALPWANTTINSWLEDLLSTCVNPDIARRLVPNVKQLLFSTQNNDSLQYPLYEILGGGSFEVIETLLKYRDQLQAASLNSSTNNSQPTPTKPQNENPNKTQQNQQFRLSAPIIKRSHFNLTNTVNASRYDVDPPSCKRPKVNHVPVSVLPPWAQQCFLGCTKFNNIQSLVFEQAFNGNDNMLVCAPTGAGKTNVALLTILQEIRKHIVDKPGLPSLVKSNDNFLIVYITPMKALATEIKEKFTNALRHLKINVKEYTGDTRIPAAELERSHLLVATPEKWDIATRRGGEDALSNRLKLLIIDEIHLLQDDRGPVLEALVSRTLRQVEQTQSMIRLVGLSATLPNCQDVGNFLRVPEPNLFIFGPEYRPVPLAMTLIGSKNTQETPQGFKQVFEENYMASRDKDSVQIDVIAVEEVMKNVKQGHQVLIFVHTRGETSRFANLLTKYVTLPVSNELNQLVGHARSMQPSLRECLLKGVGIHHAGLPRSDRLFVEGKFRSNLFQVLICTATLAWGVNLPAHTVIIKDTKVYNQEQGGYQDIGILDVHQMFGRAGRPQFDTSGHAILITTNKSLPKYTTTLVNAEPIQSRLSTKIEDFLNAEISLGTVTCRKDAFQWIKYTFLYQTHRYDPKVEEQFTMLLNNAEKELNDNLMIRTSIANDSLQPTHLGQVASMHYIPFKAVRHFNDNLRGDMTEAELLDCIFSSGMFQSLIFRNQEMSELENFRTPIPLLTPCYETAGKVNVLFQSYVSRYMFRTASLALDQGWIADNMQRVFDAIFELAIEKGWCFIAIFAMNLCKMIEHQMWWTPERKDHPLRQILKASKYNGLFQKLERLGIGVEELRTENANQIKQAVRNEQLALDAINAARRFPSINIGVRYQPMSDTIVSLTINVIFPFDWDHSIVQQTEMFWVFVQEVDGSAMYHAQEVTVDKRIAKEGLDLQVLVPLSNSNMYLITISSVRFLGVEETQEIVVKDADRTSFKLHVTEPLKIKNLKVKDVIKNDQIVKTVFNSYDEFNVIQSQLFHQAYHTDDSILICAPTSAGKTVIAELAITRMLEKDKLTKAVYIVPLKSIVNERVVDWRKKFDKQLIELTNDTNPDPESFKNARIIISTPERWDAACRSYVVRQFLKFIKLLVIDEVQLLGTTRGHVIEAVVERMNSTTNKLRIVGLSNCISNPFDIAQFLNVPYRCLFNFPQKTRMVPLTTFIRGFPGRHYGPRMAAMNKPLSDAILEHSRRKPTLVFVSSRKQTKLTALDLISFASSAGESLFYSTPQAIQASSRVKDRDLSHCLSFGVGLHHAGLITSDQLIVENLFAEGNLKLLIATSNFAWGTKIQASFVAIKGTEFFDSKTSQYVPYTVTELQQMINRAGRPGIDTQGMVMIFCEESKKDFLEDFINSEFPIESSLQPYIYDHVNAEIACGIINSFDTLMDWLSNSYFAIRLNMNPRYYGNTTIAQIAEETVKDLVYSKCIKVVNNNTSYLPTAAGRIASIFYVSYATIRFFLDRMNEVNSVVDILYLICHAGEFKEVITVRHNEDDILSQMTPKYKRNDSSTASIYTLKTFYLVQYYLSHRKMPISDFEADLGLILDTMTRLIGCFIELCASEKKLQVMINSILVYQMIMQGIWHDEVPLKALLKEQLMKDLKTKNDIKTLPQLINALNNNNNGGGALNSKALLPITEKVLLYSPNNRRLSENRTKFVVDLIKVNGVLGCNTISPHFDNRDKQYLYIIVGNPDKKQVICHRRVRLDKEKITVALSSAEKTEISDDCWAYFMFDSYIGIDQMYSISGAVVTKQLFLRKKEIIKVVKKKKKQMFTYQSPTNSASSSAPSSALPPAPSFQPKMLNPQSNAAPQQQTADSSNKKGNQNNKRKNQKKKKHNDNNNNNNNNGGGGGQAQLSSKSSKNEGNRFRYTPGSSNDNNNNNDNSNNNDAGTGANGAESEKQTQNENNQLPASSSQTIMSGMVVEKPVKRTSSNLFTFAQNKNTPDQQAPQKEQDQQQGQDQNDNQSQTQQQNQTQQTQQQNRNQNSNRNRNRHRQNRNQNNQSQQNNNQSNQSQQNNNQQAGTQQQAPKRQRKPKNDAFRYHPG